MMIVKNLDFSYKQQPLFKNFNLSIPKCKFVAVIGPNGCGKTTLLKLLGKELQVSSGVILLDDIPIDRYSPLEYARKLSYNRQNIRNVFPFTCLDYVLLGRRPYKHQFEDYNEEDLKIVQENFEKTDTLMFLEKKLTEVSGGELQRINLAKILTQQTPYLLLDESFSAMDIYHKVKSLKLLKEMVHKEKSVVCVMHDLNLVYQYSDHVIILVDGQVMVAGHPKEVLTEETIETVYGVKMSYVPGKGFFINGGNNENDD